MKHLTKNLISFAIFFSIGTFAFRYGLSHFLDNRMYAVVWILSGIYFIYNFGIGWYFGKKDYESIPLFDIGFRFHFTTFLLFNIISEVWYYLGFLSHYENITTNRYIAFFWGIGVFIHFIFYMMAQKNTIKGISKDEIFE
jgi:hypothetical protein